jgi:hypothetical protein
VPLASARPFTGQRHLPTLCLTALVLLATACGDDGDTPPEIVSLSPEAVVEYRFGDSSVPPEFHRSYTLTISRDEVHAVVDSYGDVIGERTEPLPSEVWDDLTAGLDEVAAVQPSAADISGCVGGRSRDLEVTDEGETLVSTHLYICRDEEGDLHNEEEAEQIDAYVQPAIDLLPDWDELLETG